MNPEPLRKPARRSPAALRIVLYTLAAVILLGILIIFVGALAFTIADRTNGKIITSGETRRYLLHVPRNIDLSQPVPLVITFHGFAQWPANQKNVSQWNPVADREGFIVVYPSGTNFPRRWHTSTGQGVELEKDVAFINDLIDELQTGYNIDPARIYVNGLSNGGGMTFLLGCRLSERIAATGGVGGAYMYPFDQCTPSRPVPMIIFHGTADPIVPYYGGPSRSFELPFPSLPVWVRDRAALNGCDPTPGLLPASGAVSGVQYSDCDKKADVVFYTIEGGGHTWPGGRALPKKITGETNMDISASETMWRFFQQYTLPQD